MLDVPSIKKEFPLLSTTYPKLVYLDSAASSQTPQCVLNAMNEYYVSLRANIHRGLYSLSEKATGEYEDARVALALFIGAEADEIIFTSGATSSMNMLVYALERTLNIAKGDVLVSSILDHHATLVPLQECARRRGATLSYLPLTANHQIDGKMVRECIPKSTKIVALSLASNVLGTMQNIEKVCACARNVGAIIILDAAQAVGHTPIDVRTLDCDFLFFSGHKMCGPTGIGVLYGKKEHLEKLPPAIFGGGMVEEVTEKKTTFQKPPMRFEAGTPNIAGALGLGEAVRFLRKLGLEDIEKHVQEVTAYAIQKLDAVKGVHLFCERDRARNAGVVSFTIDNIHPHDVAEVLAHEGVAVRAGHHCAEPLHRALGVSATVRASFYFYNDTNDVDALVNGIVKAKKLFL